MNNRKKPAPGVPYLPVFDGEWKDRAACAGLGTGWGFPPDPSDDMPVGLVRRLAAALYRECRPVCAGCEVRVECLVEGFETETTKDSVGIRGGFTPKERSRLLGRGAREGFDYADTAKAAVYGDLAVGILAKSSRHLFEADR